MTDKKKENKYEDRIGKFLTPKLDIFLFDMLKDSYLEKTGYKKILSGVPLPIKSQDLGNLTNVRIAQNMAFVIGCDINFDYRDNYIDFIKSNFGEGFAKVMVGEGAKAAENNDFETACVYFRAAILIDPELRDGWFFYGRAARDAYEDGESEDYIGRFKAESLAAFEKLTIKFPDFDMGFYFLGYAYLNLGLYVKTKLTWERFLQISDDNDLKLEVDQWIEKLKEPIRIEEGCNDIIAGRYEKGIEMLQGYTVDNRFNTWWPLWFYLGHAYKETGVLDLAQVALLKVLQLSPSNTDAMMMLADVYEELEDYDKQMKYLNKIKLVQQYHEEDRLEAERQQLIRNEEKSGNTLS